MEGQKTKNTTSGFAIFIRISRLFIPHIGWITLGILLSVLTILANVSLMATSGYFLAAMALSGVTGLPIDYFTPAAAIRALAITRALGRYAERLINHSATFRILAELRHWFYVHIEPLAPAVIQKYHSGDIFSRIKADIDTLENVYVRILIPMITAIISGVLFVSFLYFEALSLALVEAFGLLLAGFIFPLILLLLSRKSGKAIITISTELRQTAMDSVQGLGELLIYAQAEKQSEKLNQLSYRLAREQSKMNFYNEMAHAALILITGITLLLVLAISIPMVTNAQMPAISIAILAFFILASFEAVATMPQAFQRIPETITASRRIFELVDYPAIIKEPISNTPKPDNFDIEFNKVCFSYGRETKNILNNFSFTLKENNRLAIIGKSGIGKSTLINLLLRFYEPTDGVISLGGYPLTQYRSEELRRYFAVVPQQNELFNTSIRENLLLAQPNASQSLLEEVCRIAKIHEFIASLPKTYDTWIGEAGYKLSGGQRKRLAVARALLKPAKILILDEPGEGLDRKKEKEMLKAIFDYKKSCSILLITHNEIEGIDKINMNLE